MKTLAFSAALAAAVLATSAFAHSDKPHGAAPAAVVKEQKEWGIAGDARAVNRTITLRMKEMRFSPDRIVVKQGETIRFVLHNHGKLLHEMVIGTRKELDAHAALMLKFPTMEHDEPYMAHVSSGKASEMIWTFNRPGSFEFACLIAGHFQAGMVGKIVVQPSS
ncbi:MAG: cupredoxin family protein [Pseudomonadota bacterium]